MLISAYRLTTLAAVCTLLAVGHLAVAGDADGNPTASITPDAALKQLVDGNARYVADQREHPRQDESRRCVTVSGGQDPAAVPASRG